MEKVVALFENLTCSFVVNSVTAIIKKSLS